MCKSNASTTSTSSPNAQAMQSYQNLLAHAGDVASTPYTSYGGEFVAPVNEQQQAGISNINQNAGFAQPYIQQAAGLATQAAQPITGDQIAGFQSPYTQQVVNATQAQFNNQNAQQQAALMGKAGAQGALGGDRAGVASGILAGQQSLAQSPVIAGLYNTGYQNAQQMALAQRQQQGNIGFELGNLGVAGQGAALQGAGAQIGAGTMQQQTQQAQDAARFQEFLRQQAYPFQTTQWLAGIDTGIGSQMGGTSTTTPPPPNPWNQILGLGTAALSAFAKDGGRIKGFALGGSPYSDASGYVPSVQITPGAGAPKPPGTSGSPTGTQAGLGSLSAETKAFKGLGNLFNTSGGQTDYAYSAPEGLGNFSPTYMEGFGYFPTAAKDGGAIRLRRGFDDGGPVALAGLGTGSIIPDTFDDRFYANPASVDPKTYNTLQDYGASMPDYYGTGNVAPHMTVPPPPPSGPTAIAGLGAGPGGASDLPPEITRGVSARGAVPADEEDNGVLAYGPGAATAGFPPTEAPDAEAPKRKGLLAGLGIEMSPALRQSLLAAGFGLMASRSPYLGQAIGEAGLQGVSAYSGLQKEARTEKKTEADIQHGKDQLVQQAKIAADRLAAAKEMHETMTPYQKAQLEREALKPTGAVTEEGHPILYDSRRQGAAVDAVTGERVAKDQKVISNKTPEPSFTSDELTTMSRQYLAGDKSVLVNLGRGNQGASDLRALRKSIVAEMNKQGVTPEQQAVKMAEFQGLAAGQRALGTRTANIEMAANEARNMMKPALDLSEKIARTNWTPVNRAIQAFESGTSDPDLAAWGAANFSLVNTYVRAIAPTGVPPESAREHALKMLNTAMGPEAYRRVVQQMDIEMKAALEAPEQVKTKFRQLYGGGAGAQEPTPVPTTPAPAAPGSTAPLPARPVQTVPATGAPRLPAADRFSQLTAGGMSKQDAYAKMHAEGY